MCTIKQVFFIMAPGTRGSLLQTCVPKPLSFQVKYNYNMHSNHFPRRSIHIHYISKSSRIYSNCPLRRHITAPGWSLVVFCHYFVSFSSLSHLPVSYLWSAVHARFVLSCCKTAKLFFAGSWSQLLLLSLPCPC